MRFFLRSRQFKIILAVFCAVVVLTTSFAVIGRRMSPQTDIASAISAPFKSLFENVSAVVVDFFNNYNINCENANPKKIGKNYDDNSMCISIDINNCCINWSMYLKIRGYHRME